MPEIWRKRKRGTPNQIGQAFILEPKGDKRNLPKALQRVSLSEITDAIRDKRRDKMTPEELEEEAMIEGIIDEEKQKKNIAQRVKSGLDKLDEALEKEKKRSQLKKALEEAKAEQDYSEEGDGYDQHQERLEKIQESNQDPNPTMGDTS